MPVVRFVHPSRAIDLRSKMFTPKHISWEHAWYREARRVIPAIPDLRNTDWQLRSTDLTLRSIVFHIANSVGDQAVITIDREAGKFGRS